MSSKETFEYEPNITIPQTYNPFVSPYTINPFQSPYPFAYSDSVLDKLFITLERANYQIYHLCETINSIMNQKETLGYFLNLVQMGIKALYQKFKYIKDYIIIYIIKFKNYLFNNNNNKEEDIIRQLEKIDFLLKLSVGSLMVFFMYKIFK